MKKIEQDLKLQKGYCKHEKAATENNFLLLLLHKTIFKNPKMHTWTVLLCLAEVNEFLQSDIGERYTKERVIDPIPKLLLK